MTCKCLKRKEQSVSLRSIKNAQEFLCTQRQSTLFMLLDEQIHFNYSLFPEAMSATAKGRITPQYMVWYITPQWAISDADIVD